MVQTRKARSVKRNMSKKRVSKRVQPVGNFTAKRASFAARLAAFILDDHRGAVKWTEKGGFAAGQPYVFGVLPFLHLNISEAKFRQMLRDGQAKETDVVSKDCNSKKLNTKLKKVGFSCARQSAVGVNALSASVISSINDPNRWMSRRNGRKVASQLQRFMHKQVELGIIPASSVKWCC
jgi:hypothetical protein